MTLTYDLYSYTDYKRALKDRLKALKSHQSPITLKKLADRLGMQYTYLSKALNDETTHISEDALFQLGQWLDFIEPEVEYLLLLRSLATTQNPTRKETLWNQIESLQRKRKVSAEYQDDTYAQYLQNELEYVTSPLCTVVRVALIIKEYQQDPLRICSHLGISHVKLKSILQVLEKTGFIELGERDFEVKENKKKKIHFSKTHPLMRIRQSRLKTQLESRMLQSPEEDKESFFVTFNADEEAFKKIKARFDQFIKEVQEHAQNSEPRHLMQLNFDLLKWF